MTPGLALLLSLTLPPPTIISPSASSINLRYKRQIITRTPGESCAVLDTSVFAHAAPTLKDLRLLTASSEVPYAITLSEPAQMTSETAQILQLHPIPGGLVFDLQMPDRSYTDVDLDLQQHDFVLTATVSGSNDLASRLRTPLGNFIVFDLTARHLSHSSVIPLQESSFRYLHLELHGQHIVPNMVRSAVIPPSREAQTVYTTVLRSFSVHQQGTESIASFHVPAHVPVERVSVELSPQYAGNFYRKVHLTGQTGASGDPVEAIDGAISHVHLGSLQSQQMAFPAVMGVNLQQDATIKVDIENGNDDPLPISSVSLEMRQRSICFDAPLTTPSLFYGNPYPANLAGIPVSRRPSPLLPHSATLGPETLNPAFKRPMN